MGIIGGIVMTVMSKWKTWKTQEPLGESTVSDYNYT